MLEKICVTRGIVNTRRDATQMELLFLDQNGISARRLIQHILAKVVTTSPSCANSQIFTFGAQVRETHSFDTPKLFSVHQIRKNNGVVETRSQNLTILAQHRPASCMNRLYHFRDLERNFCLSHCECDYGDRIIDRYCLL